MAFNMPCISPNLPSYGCNPNESFDHFIKKFTRICRGFGLNDERVLALLPLSLTDKSLADYDDLKMAGEFDDLSLNEVVEKLRVKWVRAPNISIGSAICATPKMKSDQSVANYYAEIRQAAEKSGLYANKMDKEKSDSIALMRFYDGLSDISLKRHLLEKCTKTLEMTVQEALDWESVNIALQDDYNARAKVRTVNEMNQELDTTLMSLTQLNSGEMRSSLAKTEHVSTTRYRCHKCGQPGHFRKNCQQQNRYYCQSENGNKKQEEPQYFQTQTGQQRYRCHKCGQFGHFRSNCQQRDKYYSQRGNGYKQQQGQHYFQADGGQGTRPTGMDPYQQYPDHGVTRSQSIYGYACGQ